MEETPDYNVNFFFTREGYFKKITPLSLRMSGEHKLKEHDEIIQNIEGTNHTDLLFFTNKCQVYKAKASDFPDTKASVLGDFIPVKLSMDENESAISMVVTKDYSGMLLFFFENGKVAKVPLSAYATKTNRKKLTAAYSDKSPVVSVIFSSVDEEFLLSSTSGRLLLFHSGAINEKSTRSTQGVAVMRFKKGHKLSSVTRYHEGELENAARYRTKTLPALGAIPAPNETNHKQMTLLS